MSTRPRPAPSANALLRSPTLPPRPPLTIHPTAHIADKASLTGTHRITISASAVIHPFARLASTQGPIDIGEGAVVWERASVGEGKAGDVTITTTTTVLARNIVVESGAVVEVGVELGEGSVVEVGARVGAGCIIGEVSGIRFFVIMCESCGEGACLMRVAGFQFCKITPLSVVPPRTRLAPYTVVFGDDQRRVNESLRDQPGMKELFERGHLRHLETMRKLVKGGTVKWQ